MKRLLTVLFIIGAIVVCNGPVFAQNRGGWWEGGKWSKWEEQEKGEKNEKSGATEKGREERYCSYEQEGELLQLLKELKEPSSGKNNRPGGESEVRRKYRIAQKLRKFDDCRAEDALQALVKEDACEELGEGEIFCVKWAANPSLQEVKSKKI